MTAVVRITPDGRGLVVHDRFACGALFGIRFWDQRRALDRSTASPSFLPALPILKGSTAGSNMSAWQRTSTASRRKSASRTPLLWKKLFNYDLRLVTFGLSFAAYSLLQRIEPEGDLFCQVHLVFHHYLGLNGKVNVGTSRLGLYLPTKGRITVNGIDSGRFQPRSGDVACRYFRTSPGIRRALPRTSPTATRNLSRHWVLSLLPITRGSIELHERHALTPLFSNCRRVIGLSLGRSLMEPSTFRRSVAAGSLASVFLRDARIIVLDEPTASLDPKAEVEIYRQFADAAKDRTAIFVSHRLGSARLADRIIVLDRGRVVEEGTHESLLNSSGPYSRMFCMQAAWYVETTGDGETV